jgi:hypothetical protein
LSWRTLEVRYTRQNLEEDTSNEKRLLINMVVSKPLTCLQDVIEKRIRKKLELIDAYRQNVEIKRIKREEEKRILDEYREAVHL